jgi:tetratricopeptide (TPR) repeat protein
MLSRCLRQQQQRYGATSPVVVFLLAGSLLAFVVLILVLLTGQNRPSSTQASRGFESSCTHEPEVPEPSAESRGQRFNGNGGVVTKQPETSEFDSAIAKGRACFERGEHDAAIAAFSAAIRLNPRSAEAYLKRGMAYGAKIRSARVWMALASPTEIEFVETPLRDVVDYLKDLHAIDIHLDAESLKKCGVGGETPVTTHLKGVTLRTALRSMLGDLQASYLVRDDTLVITGPTEAKTADMAINDFSEAIRLDPRTVSNGASLAPAAA